MTLLLPDTSPRLQSGFARSAGEARYPQLWNGLVAAWTPSLGYTWGTAGKLRDNGPQRVDLSFAGKSVASTIGPYGPALAVSNDPIGPFTVDWGGSKVATIAWWMQTTFNNSTHLFLETSPNVNDNDGGIIVNPCASSTFFELVIQDSVGTAKYLAKRWTRPTTGVWHHYVTVFDNSTATGAITFYIDRKDQGAGTTFANTKDQASPLRTDLFLFGRNASTLGITGDFDRIRIYNRELNPAEAHLLYEHDIHEMALRRSYRVPTAAAAGRIMGSLAGHGGLAGPGGLAGERGGLAA